MRSPTCSGEYPLRELVTRGSQFGVWVDRPLARCSAWYEMFPRSTGGWDSHDRPCTARSGPRRRRCHGRRDGLQRRVPAAGAPIGKVHRKGPNNASPPNPVTWGRRGRSAATRAATTRCTPTSAPSPTSTSSSPPRGERSRVALDLALQCAPDHPWAKNHRQWFTELPTAPSPTPRTPEEVPGHLPAELRQRSGRPLRRGAAGGSALDGPRVKIFRVDNPHTKPPNFWAWLIGR